MVQRCFYSAVALKSVAVARAFSAAYVCGSVCWNVRFSATCGRTGGTCMFRQLTCQKNFEHPAPSQFSMRHGCARFQFSELGESCTFRESIPEASGRRNNSTFSLLIVGSVSFESLIFSTFHTLSLKNYYVCTVSNSPIL